MYNVILYYVSKAIKKVKESFWDTKLGNGDEALIHANL